MPSDKWWLGLRKFMAWLFVAVAGCVFLAVGKLSGAEFVYLQIFDVAILAGANTVKALKGGQ